MKIIPSSIGFGKAATPVPAVLAAIMLQAQAHAAVIDLGTASSFAVLAGSGITNTGATMINGDVGSFPTTSITGFGSVTLNGINHGGDAVTQAAKTSLVSSYNELLALPASVNLLGEAELAGTLAPGVYNAPTSIGIAGMLTLDGGGDPDAFWVFQIDTTLITATNSSIILSNGARSENVFWQVGTSATLGTDSSFVGSILADQSITANTGADIEGRLLALNAAVTLQANFITVPEPASSLMFGVGLACLLSFRRRAV